MQLNEYIKSHGFKSVKEFLSYTDGMRPETLREWYKNPKRARWLELMIKGIKAEKLVESFNK